MGVIPGGLVTNKGRGRGRGTKPVTAVPVVTPSTTAVAPPPNSDVLADKDAYEDEQFEDGVEEEEDEEGRKEPAKPKRYSSQRQKTSEEDEVKQVDNSPAPATVMAAG